MSEVPLLVTDLALILVVASFFSLLFKWLKQPVALGYIIAGIVISFFITKDNPEYKNIEIWSQIGIIFLLFGLGLEFSFRKLMKVGSTAIVAALFLVICMIGLGFLTGSFLGWLPMRSLFLGAMISMSSTMIVVKVYDDLKLTNKSFAGIVLGILILEDLVAVLLMVLLSTVAVSKKFEGTDMLISLMKLVMFLLFWIILGTYLIPTFLRKMKSFLNDEILLIFSLTLCLGMVILATQAGFSAALGAFIMGSILSETIDSERIEQLTLPIKNFFGAIFFVSVGMMVQITTLSEHIVPILIISTVVIVGQMTFATGGVLLAGQNLKTAISAGFSLSQIGEFSYIIGALGMSLKVIPESLYQIIVSSSLITIFTTPYIIKLANPVNSFLERKLPAKWQYLLNKTTSGAHPVNQDSLWKKLLSEMTSIVLIYFTICIVIVHFALIYANPLIQDILPGIKGNLVTAVITTLIISPFMRAIIIKKMRSDEFVTLWQQNKSYRAPLVATVIIRILMCVGLIMYLLFNLFHTNLVIGGVIAVIAIILMTLSKNLKITSIAIENRFRENLNEKEKYRESKALISKGFVDHAMERDLHLSEFTIEPHFSSIGKTLREFNFRQIYGINIVRIVRGERKINIPNGNEYLYPYDRIVVLGTDKQMEKFQRRLDANKKKYKAEKQAQAPLVKIGQIQIGEGSSLIGRTIRNSGIQTQYNCLVVGIERGEYSLQDPTLDFEFMGNDVVWLVGEYDNILKLSEI
ncbi:MAG: cation:proton antiporter [Tannerella sp.]|jgi:CPA2 family monovalent cation:H+ antiporter-2|nr:cation:proton antiporter [Tannerella sp.]